MFEDFTEHPFPLLAYKFTAVGTFLYGKQQVLNHIKEMHSSKK